MPRPVMTNDSRRLEWAEPRDLTIRIWRFDLLSGIDEAQLDDRVHDGGKADAAEFLIALPADR